MNKPEGYREPKVQAGIDTTLEFRRRFPDQVELCLRLTFERLQNGLSRGQPLTAHEVSALAQTAEVLYRIHRDNPTV